MEARRLRQQDKLQRQAAGAGIQTPMLVDHQKQQKQSKKESTKARRLKKKAERERKKGEQADAMEIG
jgi:tRNA A-37 threonylcarbamoyl transferase component Bud32